MTPAFVDADALVAFLESLRAAGYRIGTEKYIAAHDVALALSTEPRDRRTAERLGSLLRPLLCSTASEQEEFAGRFRQWADRIVPDRQRTVSPPPAPEPAPVAPVRVEAPLAESLASMKRKSAGFWAVTAILCAVTAYAVWTRTTTTSLATVHIQSDPEGAIVRFIEGDAETVAELAGDSLGRTGMQWDSVHPRRYTLHFHLAGYHDVIHVLDVVGDTVHHVNVALSPTPRGTLSLTSDPPGATVRLEPITREHGSELIDTVRTGTSPLEWSGISVGEYHVTWMLDDYDPVSQSIMIDSLPVTHHHIDLERARLGRIRINSEPEGAEILLGSGSAGTTPAILERPIGTYPITLRARNHRDETITITVRADEVVDTLVALTARRSGELVVHTDPAGARIVIDTVVRQADDTALIELMEGRYTVRAELQGYEPFVTEADVAADSTTIINAELALMQPPRFRVAFHPDSGMIATGDPGIAVITWEGMRTAGAVVPAAQLRIRRSGFRGARQPWNVLGTAPSSVGDVDGTQASADVLATSDDGGLVAVASSGPTYRFSNSQIYGDSATDIALFDELGRTPPVVLWIGNAGGGVLAMRFNGAGDSLRVVTRNGRIVTIGQYPCTGNRSCSLESRWRQGFPAEALYPAAPRIQTMEVPLRAATFESDSIVSVVDTAGIVRRYDRLTQTELSVQTTGINDARQLVTGNGITVIATGSNAAHIAEDPLESGILAPDYTNVTSIAMLPDANVLVAGKDSGGVYSRIGSTVLMEILPRRHRGFVSRVALSPDGRALVSAGTDGTLALWDLERQKWIGSVWLHRIGITSLDSAVLGRQRWNDAPASFATFGRTEADNVRLYYADEANPAGRAAGAGSAGSAGRAAFNPVSQFVLRPRFLQVRALTFSSDGNTVVISTSDGYVRRWNVALADRPDWRQRLLQNVAFSPDNTQFVVPGAAGTVEVWDTWLREKRETLTGHAAHVTGIDYSPDGTLLATGDASGEVRLWSRTPQIRHWLTAFGPLDSAGGGRGASLDNARPLAFSPDGGWLASRGDDNDVLIWDVESGRLDRTIAIDTAAANALAFSPGGRWLAAGDAAGGVRVAPFPIGESLPMVRVASASIQSVAWLSDSTFVTATAQGLRAFAIRDTSAPAYSSNTVPSIVAAEWVLSESGWINDGQPIVFSGDGRTIAWEAALRPANPDQPAGFEAFLNYNRRLDEAPYAQIEVQGPSPINTMALSDNGHWLAIADDDRNIRVFDKRPKEWEFSGVEEDAAFPWSEEAGTLVLENAIDSFSIGGTWTRYGAGHADRILAIAFSPDARMLVTAAADSTIVFWDVQRGERIGGSNWAGDAVRSLVFQPGGRMLAALGEGGTIRIWDLGIGIPLKAHGKEVTSLSFSPDGRRLATSSADSTIVVWDLWGMQAFDTVRANHIVESIAFSPDGRQLIAATADSVVHLWDASGSRVATIRQWLRSALAFGLLIALGITAFALHRFLWRRRASRMLVRRTSDERPDIHHFALRNVEGHVFPRAPMLDLARRLRRRVEIPSDHLDVPETVTRSVRRGGVFTAAFVNRQERPAYVALVDRASIGDQQAAFVDDLLDRLAADEVQIERYYFDCDARMCFPRSRRKPPLPLAMVAQRNAGSRLLLFGDATALFDPVTGEPIAWVNQLRAWPERALLTPEPRQHWSQREARLENDFAVATATHTGLLGLTDRSMPPDGPPPTGRYPSMLRRRPRRWVERDRPDTAEVERMIAAVREYLDEPGFLWLCACAVYPEMSWRLTVNLGILLRDDRGQQFVTADRLAALARLPWFRHDYMPDWVRNRLLDEMSQQREAQVRTAIEQLLVAAIEGRDDPHDLEIAKQQARTLHSLARALLAVMKRNAKPDDAARDYVFQAFMSGRRAERLAVRLPRALLMLINRSQRDAVPARLAADARRLQIAGLAGVPILALLVFGGTTAWKNVPEAMVRLGTPQRFDNGRGINVDSMLAAQQGPIQQAIETPAATEPQSDPPVADADTVPGSGMIDRANFFDAYRTAFGDLDYQASAGLDELLGFLENDPDMRDIRLRAYVLATVKYGTSDRFVPTTTDNPRGYQQYEPGTPLGNQVGNKVPGDGELFRPRGYNGLTGRDNYYRMSQELGFQPKMSTLVDNPDKANEPHLAYRIMSLGMRGGLFTGRKLSDYINETQTDYFNASAVNGNNQASRQLEFSARRFEDILRQSADRTPVTATSR